jgi:hypothetical protein
MSFAEFQRAISSGGKVPDGLSAALLGLWHDARGDWDKAHAAAQSDSGAKAAWVHAYLHRKEGDRANARYLYGRAGRPMPGPNDSLKEEWTEIAGNLLAG